MEEYCPGPSQTPQLISPKAAYLAAGHSSQEVYSALGTLPGLHEEQEEEPVDVVIFPSAQSRHSPTPPTE